MPRTTVLPLAHPDLARSPVTALLAAEAREVATVSEHDPHGAYPDLRIDVTREHELLLTHDRIVLQCPTYWRTVPALLKRCLVRLSWSTSW